MIDFVTLRRVDVCDSFAIYDITEAVFHKILILKILKSNYLSENITFLKKMNFLRIKIDFGVYFSRHTFRNLLCNFEQRTLLRKRGKHVHIFWKVLS